MIKMFGQFTASLIHHGNVKFYLINPSESSIKRYSSFCKTIPEKIQSPNLNSSAMLR